MMSQRHISCTHHAHISCRLDRLDTYQTYPNLSKHTKSDACKLATRRALDMDGKTTKKCHLINVMWAL